MVNRIEYERRYAEAMKRMWNFSSNDQRPEVLAWISGFGRPKSVLDIGPGDAYYMGALSPSSCTLVEPNAQFRAMAGQKCADLNASAKVFSCVGDLLQADTDWSFDLVLMIHVLFYMGLDEVRGLLEAVNGKPLALVYPWPASSVTVGFETAMGLTGCIDRIELKRAILGTPASRYLVESHFRLPTDTSDDELAFLVAHAVIHREPDQIDFSDALDFVRTNKQMWIKADFLEMPQAQVLETYNF